MMCELETVINNNNIAIGVGVIQFEDGRTGGTMDGQENPLIPTASKCREH
jgi:hypothetical protein